MVRLSSGHLALCLILGSMGGGMKPRPAIYAIFLAGQSDDETVLTLFDHTINCFFLACLPAGNSALIKTLVAVSFRNH